MKTFEERLKSYIVENNIEAQYYVFTETCHSVEEAALAANVSPDCFIKSICMIKHDGGLVVAIVKGEDRASTSKVAKVLGIEEIRIATADEILKMTGYQCGGVPAFGYDAVFLIDSKVMETEKIYTGGGSEYSLLKISTKDMLKLNKGQVVRIRR